MVGGDQMDFTYLNVETHYAMNGSNIRIQDLIEKAKTFGFSSLAIADPKMYGVLKFYEACIKNNIKPLIGQEILLEGIQQEKRNKVLVYALNNEGYQNLLTLSSIMASDSVVSLSQLKHLNSGILGIYITNNSELFSYFSSNQKNAFLEVIDSLNNHFKDYFISVSQSHDLNHFFETRQKLIYADKISYLNEQDQEVTNVLKQIFNKNIDDLFDQENGTYYKPYIPENHVYKNALENIDWLIHQANVSIDFSKTYLPSYKHNKKVSSKEYLDALVYKGLEKRLQGKKVNKKIYLERVQYELSVIDTMGYNDYFLIVWDFVKYARSKEYLVGPGRGSAAASLVSYCLGITSVDSIEYDLVFERFLNPERITLPDIDMDLPDDKRDDIILYVKEFYGKDHVASICTFGTFLMKSAIRDTARVLQIDGILIEEVIQYLTPYNSIKTALIESSEIKNMMQQSEPANQLILIASQIEGLNKHVSTHAAGIIVSAEELTKHTAVQPGLLQMHQTQFEASDLEHIGMLKIDFLGLRNLSSIDNIVRMINQNEKTHLDIYKVPLDDQLTYQLLQRVDTTGVFQLESPGMRSLIRQMQMKDFEDIVTVLALFRPGPMENIPGYIKRRFGEETVSYPHPLLEEVLKSTHGIIIFQEQIVKIASLFAGYSLGEADLLRRAVSKKQQEVLNKERENFVNKATKMGRELKVSNEIYDYIVKFANYGFNRAHSVAYAMVSYWMAYLKANYPKYFISVLTSSVIGSETQMRNYIFEANKLGVKILPPSVNLSTMIFEPEDQNLRYPLLGIKNVGVNNANSLLEIRNNKPFTSFIDFVSRTHTDLNKRVIESLIKAGALDEFGLNKKTMLLKLEEVINYTMLGSFIQEKQFTLNQLEEYGFEELKELEKSVLGYNLTVNPLSEFTEYIAQHKLQKPSDLSIDQLGKQVRIIGTLSSMRKIKTKNDKYMAFVTIQDEFSQLDGVVFPNVFLEHEVILQKNKVYLFMVKIEERNTNLQLVVEKIHLLSK